MLDIFGAGITIKEEAGTSGVSVHIEIGEYLLLALVVGHETAYGKDGWTGLEESVLFVGLGAVVETVEILASAVHSVHPSEDSIRV